LPRSTHGAVSDIRHDIHAIFSEARRDIMTAHTAMVSDIHRTMAKVQEGGGGMNLLVSEIRTLSTAECPLTVA